MDIKIYEIGLCFTLRINMCVEWISADTLVGSFLGFISAIVAYCIGSWISDHYRKKAAFKLLDEEKRINIEELGDPQGFKREVILLRHDAWNSLIMSGFVIKMMSDKRTKLYGELYALINAHEYAQEIMVNMKTTKQHSSVIEGEVMDYRNKIKEKLNDIKE